MVRADFAKDPSFNKRFQIVINGRQRDGWNLLAHGVVDFLGRIVPARRGCSVENDPALMRRCQMVFLAETIEIQHLLLWHSYQMIIIIKRFSV